MTLGIMVPSGQAGATQWHALDVSESSSSLAFTMTRASDGKQVTQADYRGRIVLLYLGYTFCPDVCPTTLSNLADVLEQLGASSSDVRVLFVTVDPRRDTLPVLAEYAANFAPQVEGLRGTPDQLAALARRYRLVYSVTPGTKDHPYEVTHSSAIYIFDRSGAARLLVSSFDSPKPDVKDLATDLRRLIEETSGPNFLVRLQRWL
ncbi:MAG: SCO family protein [Proteobacteria bacterium]|nr:SCO family protein [Pseudomonadota bacterium]